MKRFSDELEEGEEIEDDCNDTLNADDWDDTALIEAWDLAKNEYLKYHGLEQEKCNKKQKITENYVCDDKRTILKDSQVQNVAETDTIVKDQEETTVKDEKDQENQEDKKDQEEEEEKEEEEKEEKSKENPISADQLNALMAWYWAGYYTAKLSF